MKYLFISVFLLFNYSLLASTITFHGKIINPPEQAIQIHLLNEDVFLEKVIYRANLNENNEFLISFDLKRSQLVEFKIGEKRFDVFASLKNQKIEFELDAIAPVQTIRFKGNDAANNSFYNSFQRTYRWNFGKKEKYVLGGLTTTVDSEIKTKAISYSIHDYFRLLDNDYKSQIQYLSTAQSIDLDFFKYLNNEVNWRYEINKLSYFLFNKDRFSTHELNNFWARYGLLRNADVNDNRSINEPTFQNLLCAFVHFLHLQTPVESKLDESYFTFVKKNLMNRPRYFMLAKLMVNNYQVLGNAELAQKEFKFYKKENPFSEYTIKLEQIFGNDMQYVASKLAPDLKVLDLNEREIYLSNYSGKVVYVSFWASWCAPCIKGFRETAQLRTKLKNDGVVFLNINIDENEEIWRRFLANENIIGENVYALDIKDAKEELKITSLPHYFLVNKFGQIDYLTSKNLNECYEDFMKLLVK